jgi:CSLREA domain-containing protein
MNWQFRFVLLVITPLAGMLGAVAWVGGLARADGAMAPYALTVNTLEDELNSDGDCSLREAIEAANTNAAVDDCPPGNGVVTDTIVFSAAGTITLTQQLSVSAGGPLVI